MYSMTCLAIRNQIPVIEMEGYANREKPGVFFFFFNVLNTEIDLDKGLKRGEV